MVRKRRAGACKQKITERCVNISKIKKNYLSPTNSLLSSIVAKTVPEMKRNAKCKIRKVVKVVKGD